MLSLVLFFLRRLLVQFFFHRQSRACGEADHRAEVFGGDLAHKMFIGEILSFQGSVVHRAGEVDGEGSPPRMRGKVRVSDVLQLRTVDLKRRQTVRESKTGKTRRIQWPAELYAEMERRAGRYWVFEGRTDPKKHRQRQTVWRDIKRAEAVFKRSGALSKKQNLGTHSARKYAAVTAYHKGGMDAAQRLLNHSDPLITRLYALADLEV